MMDQIKMKRQRENMYIYYIIMIRSATFSSSLTVVKTQHETYIVVANVHYFFVDFNFVKKRSVNRVLRENCSSRLLGACI